MERMRDFCDEIEDLLMGNEIFAARCRGVGVIPADVALSYGLSGANLRASGVDWDLRRDVPGRPALRPGRLEGLDPPRRRLVRPLLGAPPGGPRVDPHHRPAPRRPALRARSWPRSPASSRCPRARPTSPPRTRSGRWATTSSARATSCPFRVKIRTPSFNNISIVPWVMKGVYVPDVITILGQPLLHPGGHRPVIALHRPSSWRTGRRPASRSPSSWASSRPAR